MRYVLIIVAITCMTWASNVLAGDTPILRELMHGYPFDAYLVPLGMFDTARGATNAIALRMGMAAPDRTMYLRTPLDTSNSYAWKYGAPRIIGHFNGNLNFVNDFGVVYSSSVRGIPPNQDSLLLFPMRMMDTIVGATSYHYPTIYVYDINQDHYDDLFLFIDSADGLGKDPHHWGLIWYGNAQLGNVKIDTIQAPSYHTSGTSINVLKVFPKGQEWRIVWREESNEEKKFCIGRLIIGVNRVQVERLNEMKFGDPTFYRFLTYANQVVYYNRRTGEATLLGIHGTTGLVGERQGINVFSLDRDTLDYVRTLPYLYEDVYTFDDTMNEPYNEGWVAVSKYPEDGDSYDVLSFFAGSPRSGERVGRTKDYTLIGTRFDFKCIGDISNDGISDYAMIRNRSLYFLEGVGVPNAVPHDNISMDVPSLKPQPVIRNNPFVMTIYSHVAQDCLVELFDLNGVNLGTVVRTNLQQGESKLTLTLTRINPAPGTYILRATTASMRLDRMIVVTE